MYLYHLVCCYLMSLHNRIMCTKVLAAKEQLLWHLNVATVAYNIIITPLNSCSSCSWEVLAKTCMHVAHHLSSTGICMDLVGHSRLRWQTESRIRMSKSGNVT